MQFILSVLLRLSLFVEIYLHRLWPPNTGSSAMFQWWSTAEPTKKDILFCVLSKY
jgi:hypothetical protein